MFFTGQDDPCKRIPHTKLPSLVESLVDLDFLGIYIYILYIWIAPSVYFWIMLEEHSGKQRTTFNVWYMLQPKVKLLQS